ncbi:MAG: ParB/RepB/Spo0J family partition protein, partial [Bacteroidota bacterium]
LGKGLGALLSNAETDITTRPGVSGVTVSPQGSAANIPVSQIEVNPFQPRNDFDTKALEELAESIRHQGIIQAITVRKVAPDRYQIISGERRFRASKMAGLETIPAYVRIANDQAMLEMALVENIQRENLNPIDIAISYKRLMEECKLSHDEVSDKVGKDRTTVTNYIRLLKLPPKIQDAIRDGKISMGHARALINIDDVGTQLLLLSEILTKGISVRKVEEMVRTSPGRKKPGSKTEGKVVNQPAYRDIEKRLENLFETKVEIKTGAKGSGKIMVSYYSTDDLNRLLDMLDH